MSDLILSFIYNPVITKLKELEIWSGDRSFISIRNNISSATFILKKSFPVDDVLMIKLYEQRYLDFRKEANSTFLTLQLVFSDLDEGFKELFDFFRDTEENEFESFKVNTIKCSNIEETLKLYRENSKKNNRFSLPFGAMLDFPRKKEDYDTYDPDFLVFSKLLIELKELNTT
ncbi:hypothetical protein HP439_04560 [Sphingobacterium shayense]|uniref:hypothetical protein n=1 Tax=Sphingobacterium shayense TaxID=626343 RepID=UPI0015567EA1|nr:hypothetical protein [Sphingobacterium shayense]NQD69993.1 hypothetical protein [Sphingobacterium shayense]